ncbi:MAG: matrixin family metalloprotease [Bdellovibrio sp.]
MRLKTYFKESLQTVGASILLISINNCAPQKATEDTASLSRQSSALVSQVADGDHVVTIYTPEGDLPSISVNKVYYDGSSDPTNAPRWKSGAINWYYNPSGAPSSLSSAALATIQQSMSYWSSYCNVKFNYMGETDKSSEGGPRDTTNVIGWGGANGATGITFMSIYGRTPAMSISESDINLNARDIRDTTTLSAVVNHELGHMLGLKHSDVSESIMYANPYHDVQYLLTLRADDISGCVGLYGAASSVAETPVASETPPVMETPVASQTPANSQTPATSPTPTAPVTETAPPPSTGTVTEGSTSSTPRTWIKKQRRLSWRR